jgi:hypothetical protein
VLRRDGGRIQDRFGFDLLRFDERLERGLPVVAVDGVIDLRGTQRPPIPQQLYDLIRERIRLGGDVRIEQGIQSIPGTRQPRRECQPQARAERRHVRRRHPPRDFDLLRRDDGRGVQ